METRKGRRIWNVSRGDCEVRQSGLVKVRLVTVRTGTARQSCLGTFRPGAVMFGEVRYGSRGKLWCAEVWRGFAGLGGAGQSRSGDVGRVTVRFGMVRQSRWRKVRLDKAGCVLEWRGSRGLVRSRLESCGLVIRGSCGTSGHGELWNGRE